MLSSLSIAVLLCAAFLLGRQSVHIADDNSTSGECITWEQRQICSGMFIGLKEDAAGKLAEQYDLEHRVIEREGKGIFHTFEMRPDRINFSIDDGLVVQATFG